MGLMERIRIETLTKGQSAAGGRTTTTSSSETWWAEWICFPAETRARYQSVDKEVTGELRFRGSPTIGMRNTRFVWVTKGHPWYLKVLWPATASDNIDGTGRLTSVVVVDRGETADE